MHRSTPRGRFAALLLATLSCTLAHALELEGVRLAPSIQLGATTLQLNGAGVRTRVIFKVYVAGLYVPQVSHDAATLLAQTGPRRVALTMLRNVDAQTFAKALDEGLHNNLSADQLSALAPRIGALHAELAAIGEVAKGDAIDFEFLPDQGTLVIVNGRQRGEAIAGADFFAAVLRVWLGDKPADSDLKEGMLGR